jgi:pimeloyl-ACP methyl ester carboxylesterase
VASPNRGRAVAVLALLLSILASCDADASPGSVAGSRQITFPSSDGVTLSGRVFGPQEGAAGVVLAHMFPTDQSAWFDFATRLGERGYRVLTFNFRGYCPGGDAGCSQGEKSIPAIWQDVEGAIEALRDEGATRIALVGASMGGTACLVAASREGQDIDAVVTLSAPTGFEGLDAGPDVLAEVEAAKLFIAGHADTAAAEAVNTLYAETLQPKRPVILTTGDHGTDILTGNQAGIASTEIIRWLERYLPASRPVEG